jgi:AraC-like DNA-binding protein
MTVTDAIATEKNSRGKRAPEPRRFAGSAVPTPAQAERGRATGPTPSPEVDPMIPVSSSATAPKAPWPARLVAHERRIGRISITLVRSTERHAIRDRAAIDAEPDDAFVLVIPVGHRHYFSHAGRNGVIEPGEYVLFSRSEFCEIAADDGLFHWLVRIPAGELRSRLPAIDEHLAGRFAPNKQMAQLALELVISLAATFAEHAPPNPEALATEVVAMFALVIGSEHRDAEGAARQTRYRLRRRIFDYIEVRLGDVDLNPRRIAAENRISLSYLYSLFSDHQTTVSQFIQTKRLQRAYELLVGDPKGTLTISEIAYRVGFKNTSHFSRSFNQHFHMPPSEARLGPRRTASGGAGQAGRHTVLVADALTA